MSMENKVKAETFRPEIELSLIEDIRKLESAYDFLTGTDIIKLALKELAKRLKEKKGTEK